MTSITHIPARQVLLSPQKYLESLKDDKANIERVQFMPPQLGDGSFGKYLVTYRFPKLMPTHGER